MSTEKFTLESFHKKIAAEYGDVISSCGSIPRVARFSTGIYPLDRALGGGWPFGKIVLLGGEYRTGKSTLAIKAAAQIPFYDAKTKKHISLCDEGFSPGKVLYCDSERAVDPVWANINGLDPEHVYMLLEQAAEDVVDLISEAISANVYNMIVIDSLHALAPREMLNKSAVDNMISPLARIMTRAFPKWMYQFKEVIKAGEIPPLILIVNQYRNSMVIKYGDPRKFVAGDAQLYYSAVIVKMNTAKKIQNRADIKEFGGAIHKNRTYPTQDFSFKMTTNPLEMAERLGYVDNVSPMFDDCIEIGAIEKEGSKVRIADLGGEFATQRDLKEMIKNDLFLYEKLRADCAEAQMLGKLK